MLTLPTGLLFSIYIKKKGIGNTLLIIKLLIILIDFTKKLLWYYNIHYRKLHIKYSFFKLNTLI